MDFEAFGRKIYETAMQHFIDNKGIKTVEVPLKHPEYGAITTVKFERPLTVVKVVGEKFYHYYVMSDGTLKLRDEE